MKSKLMLALLAIFISNTASAEYMMCYNVTPKFARIKNATLKCEVDEQTVSNAKFDELAKQGWKVEHMAISNAGNDSFFTNHYLMVK